MTLLRVSNDANSDFPKQDPAHHHSLILSGLDAIAIRCKTGDPKKAIGWNKDARRRRHIDDHLRLPQRPRRTHGVVSAGRRQRSYVV